MTDFSNEMKAKRAAIAEARDTMTSRLSREEMAVFFESERLKIEKRIAEVLEIKTAA